MECGILVYGKIPKSKADFNSIQHKNLTTEVIRSHASSIPFYPSWEYPHQPAEGLEIVKFIDAALDVQEQSGFVKKSTPLDQLVVGAPHEEAVFVNYAIATQQVDGFGRPFPNYYVIIAPKTLALDIISFIKEVPQEAQQFFMAMVESPKYSAPKRKGLLYIINGNLIPPDDKGNRKSPNPWRQNFPGRELIKYEVK